MPIELTVTSKGQVTLRRSVLAHLGVDPGRKLGATLLPGGRVELRPLDTAASLANLRGALMRPDQRVVTLEEMQQAIEQAV